MIIVIRILFALGLVIFLIDLLGLIMYIFGFKNTLTRLAFRGLSQDKIRAYKPLLIIKIMVMAIFLSVSLYAYIKKINMLCLILLIMDNVFISFYERIVKEL
ncbi:hypothetical protein [Peptoniphilus catoniae]|uniref:hypothetical protein n=1 Tax=Peptoniphilus catoniae TaxID=1660341 RepID=UPI0010FD9B81|nr:hypothetical protein [Peptoniphilus catoniae]